MFLIFGIGQRKGGEFQVCDKSGRRYTVFYIANCFSLFFIPLINLSKAYYISVSGSQSEITKEEYLNIKETRLVPEKYGFSSEFSQAFEYERQENTGKCRNDVCPVCKKKLEKEFSFCPYCGQKQPRV